MKSVVGDKCTCEVDGADGIDMVMHVGGVRPALAAICSCKLRPRAFHSNAQPVPAPHRRSISTLNGRQHETEICMPSKVIIHEKSSKVVMFCEKSVEHSGH